MLSRLEKLRGHKSRTSWLNLTFLLEPIVECVKEVILVAYYEPDCTNVL